MDNVKLRNRLANYALHAGRGRVQAGQLEDLHVYNLFPPDSPKWFCRATGCVVCLAGRCRVYGRFGVSTAPIAYVTAAEAVSRSAVLWIRAKRAFARSRSAASSSTMVLSP